MKLVLEKLNCQWKSKAMCWVVNNGTHGGMLQNRKDRLSVCAECAAGIESF